MKFLATEEGRVGSLVCINFLLASAGQPIMSNIEMVLRLVLLAAQIAVAALTAWYIYRKGQPPK